MIKRIFKKAPKSGEINNNYLLIIDSSTKERRTSFEMPAGSWTELELLPMSNGNLRLLCRYPTGSIDNLFSGHVKKDYGCKIKYQSEAEGIYELWFTLDGYKSNTITFRVIQGSEKVAMPPSGKIGSFAPFRSIGFSTGGAKDIGNFRENIEMGFLPLPTDVTFEGLAYGYYFQTEWTENCRKLFCPSYSYAISRDPFSGELAYYLSVGLNSGIIDFHRNKLNLVVVLDRSGSMSTTFNQYYYDRFGNRVEARVKSTDKTKMEIASQAIVNLLDHLKEDDRFGLIVFSDNALIVEPLTPVKEKNIDKLREIILEIREYGGTNMEAGIRKGNDLISMLRKSAQVQVRDSRSDEQKYEDRIIFLTDAMPNTGEIREIEMLKIFKENAAQQIYTTFMGIGVDFNSELVENITKIQGANYYSIHSAEEFKKRMDEEFNYMVTPLVFDLQLHLDACGYEIERIYGSPEAEESKGEIMKVNTLFLSKAGDGAVKGGLVLIKLRRISSEKRIILKITYKDKDNVLDGGETELEMGDRESEFYQGPGIRKAILLSRYSDLLKNWLMNEIREKVASENSPVKLGKWERQSLPLHVPEHYKDIFKLFGAYLEREIKALGDESLKREQAVLEKLSRVG